MVEPQQQNQIYEVQVSQSIQDFNWKATEQTCIGIITLLKSGALEHQTQLRKESTLDRPEQPSLSTSFFHLFAASLAQAIKKLRINLKAWKNSNWSLKAVFKLIVAIRENLYQLRQHLYGIKDNVDISAFILDLNLTCLKHDYDFTQMPLGHTCHLLDTLHDLNALLSNVDWLVTDFSKPIELLRFKLLQFMGISRFISQRKDGDSLVSQLPEYLRMQGCRGTFLALISQLQLQTRQGTLKYQFEYSVQAFKFIQPFLKQPLFEKVDYKSLFHAQSASSDEIEMCNDYVREIQESVEKLFISSKKKFNFYWRYIATISKVKTDEGGFKMYWTQLQDYKKAFYTDFEVAGESQMNSGDGNLIDIVAQFSKYQSYKLEFKYVPRQNSQISTNYIEESTMTQFVSAHDDHLRFGEIMMRWFKSDVLSNPGTQFEIRRGFVNGLSQMCLYDEASKFQTFSQVKYQDPFDQKRLAYRIKTGDQISLGNKVTIAIERSIISSDSKRDDKDLNYRIVNYYDEGFEEIATPTIEFRIVACVEGWADRPKLSVVYSCKQVTLGVQGDFKVPIKGISRVHCTLFHEAGIGWMVHDGGKDKQSQLGTYLSCQTFPTYQERAQNKVPIGRDFPLEDGQLFIFGTIQMQVSEVDGEEEDND